MFDLDYLVDDFLTSRYEDQHGDPDLDKDNSDYLAGLDYLSEFELAMIDSDYND